MKNCSTCKILHPLSMYHKNKSTKDGYHAQCKNCVKEYCIRTREAKSIYKIEYRSRNKEALAIKDKEYYLRTREKRLAYGTEYRMGNKEALALRATKKYHRTKEATQANTMANWEQHMLHNTKANAKRRGIECVLVLNDVTIPEKCPYLTIPLTRVVGKGQLLTNASIDRIDNSRGYSKDNIQVISVLANTMKNNATKEQLSIFAKNVLKIHPINKGE